MGCIGKEIRSPMNSTPAPYNMANDDIIMLMLIMNMIGISYVFVMNGASILERIKCIFYYESKSTPFNDRTHITKICNALLYAQAIFYTAILVIHHLQKSSRIQADENILPTMCALCAFFAATLLIKRIAYDTVNNILFGKHEAQEWRDLYFFTIKLLGFFLAPVAIAILFIPGASFTFVKFYLLILFIAHSFTLLSGLKKIIFVQRHNYLDIFLYLCALEFLPTAVVWKLVLQLNEFITIKI